MRRSSPAIRIKRLLSSAMMSASSTSSVGAFASRCHARFQNELECDPESEARWPNQESRRVHSGHYVKVEAKPLRDPVLAIHSPKLIKTLGLPESAADEALFAQYFSGDVVAGERAGLPGIAWATPYALAIYGQRYTDNCPFGDGKGYGDGRALSVTLVDTPCDGVWELQLKGAGPTPFCRGADGRAVLRSSVREFLASEAMHGLGASTTRALSLVVSAHDVVHRPWYSPDHSKRAESVKLPDRNDPALRGYPPEMLDRLLQQVMYKFRQPDIMRKEKCAITCRAAPSFMRVGHFDLYARRAERLHGADRATALEQLESLVWYAARREFSAELGSLLGKHAGGENTRALVLAVLDLSSKRIARLTADWIRVGYCQGNFNSDNCLIAGRTMDFGPFGFIEKFEPLWNMWVGGGEHFGFLNQPVAGSKNFGILSKSMMPLLTDASGKEEAQRIADRHEERAKKELDDVWRRKLGFSVWSSEADDILQDLLRLMHRSQADYTLLWRQLADFVSSDATVDAFSDATFFAPLTEDLRSQWNAWMQRWKSMVSSSGQSEMIKASPKYVPREWMLVEAYEAAEEGDFSLVKKLHEIFLNPYADLGESYEKYCVPHAELVDGIGKGGTAYMT